MSRSSRDHGKGDWQPGSGKAQRYIQPSLLLALKLKPSYGYELIQEIAAFGFVEGPAPPGMVYRHLRDMEENEWVKSEWHTEDAGPAKRIYQLTDEGEEILAYWIAYMARQVEKLSQFITIYRATAGG
jgi:poly-beta-hydroxybutyrate-responsive repressor